MTESLTDDGQPWDHRQALICNMEFAQAYAVLTRCTISSAKSIDQEATTSSKTEEGDRYVFVLQLRRAEKQGKRWQESIGDRFEGGSGENFGNCGQPGCKPSMRHAGQWRQMLGDLFLRSVALS